MLGLQDGQFDIFEWYPQFQSCLRYFLDHAQYSGPVQAVAAFVNIQLPYQRPHNPTLSSRSGGSPSAIPSPSTRASGAIPLSSSSSAFSSGSGSLVTLTPYIRRLVATGFDFPGVLHGFFGDDWVAGVGRLHEVERRNYLFAAKSACWLDVKRHYDEGEGQSVPFLRPLQHSTEEEIANADSQWSEWLAMQDWLIGPRSLDNLDAPNTSASSPPPRFKREPPDDRHDALPLVKDVDGVMSNSRCLALPVEQMKALQIDKSEDCRLPMTPEASGGSAEEEESGKEHSIPNHYWTLVRPGTFRYLQPACGLEL
ncbi:hypothetical protein KJ359_010815 [Pestalotiopsis sp. 9143b]|nr:hypothetical protein KJ359_010815 [Pestalotiopsis sp. 9143b]